MLIYVCSLVNFTNYFYSLIDHGVLQKNKKIKLPIHVY